MQKTVRTDFTHRLDIVHRPRRNRKAEWARAARPRKRADDQRPDLAAVPDRGRKARVPVAAMPGVERLSVDEAVREAERAVKLGIPAIAFFPYTEPSLKDEGGSEAFNEQNLVCRACRAIKEEFPGLGLITDVALDPYTSHGHDGLMSRRRDPQRRERRRAGQAGAQPGARRRRRHRALGHDGRPRRRDPRGARRRRLPRRPDPRLRRQIRLGLLRPVPRRGRLVGRAEGRQAHLSDGPRPIPTRRCARSNSTSTRAPTW